MLSKNDMNLNLTHSMASSLLHPDRISSTVVSKGVPFQKAGFAGDPLAMVTKATKKHTLTNTIVTL